MIDITDYIPTGKENAITRERLCKITGLSDRIIRKAVEIKRREGIPIMSSAHTKGYWMSDDVDEWEAFLQEYDHRISAMRKSMAKLKKRYYERTGVKTTKVCEHIRRIRNSDESERQVKMEGFV